MQLQQMFDARNVEPSSFAPPPPLADYHVRIVESDAKPTKDNLGGYLQLILEILDPGPYQGRRIPYNLNIYNNNQQTVEISYRQLSAVCHVTGVFQIQDSRQLHNIPFIATIGPQTKEPQFANVFGVKDLNGNMPGKSAGSVAVPAQQAPAPQAAPPAQPWGAPPPVAPVAPAQAAPWGAPATPPAQPAAPAQPWTPQPQAAPAQQPAAPAAAPWGAAAPSAAPPWAR